MKEKKKLPLPLLILLIGLGLGLLISAFGLYKQIDAKRINKERADIALKQSEAAIKAANERLAEIEKEYSSIKEQYENKEQECTSMNMSDANWFANHSKCQRESSELYSKMTDLEQENFVIQNNDYTAYYQLVEPMSYYIFYIIGGSIFFLAALGAFIIYLVKGKKTY